MRRASQLSRPLNGVHFWQWGSPRCEAMGAATTWCFRAMRCCGRWCRWRMGSMRVGVTCRCCCGQRAYTPVPRYDRSGVFIFVWWHATPHVEVMEVPSLVSGCADASALQRGHAGGGGGELGVLDVGWADGVCAGRCVARGRCENAASASGCCGAGCCGAVCCGCWRCKKRGVSRRLWRWRGRGGANNNKV